MEHRNILSELEAYCHEVGLKPSTVCVRALNDSRYVARLKRRLAAMDRDAERLRDYMLANPASDQGGHSA